MSAGDGGERAGAPVYHVITPGDHFSPRTGSAIPTVVHGLATGAAQHHRLTAFPQHVVVQRGTYLPRYESAVPLEYAGGPPPNRRERLIDAALGRIGLPRVAARRAYAPVADVLHRAPRGIVVAHNGPQLARLLQGSGHRVVLYAHNDLFRSMTPREAVRAVEHFDRVVSVSSYLQGILRGKMPPGLHERFRVVRNGVDTTQFSPARQAHSDSILRVMTVGRVTPDKGADVFLEAAALLNREDVEFVVVGSQGFDRGAPLSEYERHLREVAAAIPRVKFQPFVDRELLPVLLRTADLVVVPGRWQEPWALTVGEALATGIPVIATRVGGVPEQLGELGILVEPEDIAGLARALESLLGDSDLRHRAGTAARELAVNQDWRWAWDAFDGVLSELAVEAPPSLDVSAGEN